MTGHPAAARSQQPGSAAVLSCRRASVCTPEHRASRTALAAYSAFHERHYEPYLQYAALRIGQRGAAELAVAAAFTELAVCWTAILGSARPAALAWRILADHVDQALGGNPPAVPAGQLVQTLRHDARFLHERMHLSRDRIADVLGIRAADLPSMPPRSPQE